MSVGIFSFVPNRFDLLPLILSAKVELKACTSPSHLGEYKMMRMAAMRMEKKDSPKEQRRNLRALTQNGSFMKSKSSSLVSPSQVSSSVVTSGVLTTEISLMVLGCLMFL